MSGRRFRSRRTAPQPVGEERFSLGSEILRHGHGWVAALASVAGVAVTVMVATGGPDDPPVTPSPSAVSAASATSAASPMASGAGGSAGSASSGTGGSSTDDVTTNADLQPILEAFDLPSAEPYAEYALIADPDHGMQVEAPTTWTDTFVGNWLGNDSSVEEVIGKVAVATPSERGLYAGYSTEGIFFAASTEFVGMTGEEVMDAAGWSSFHECRWAGAGDFSNDGYVDGRYALFTSCLGEEIVLAEIAAPARDGSHIIYLHARMTSRADPAAVVRALDTFRFDPATGGDQLTP